MPQRHLCRNCLITGTTFGISHLIFGLIVYFLVMGISTISTLTIFCVFFFVIISIVFFIIGCKKLCSLEEEETPYIITAGIVSLFSSISCVMVNVNWLKNTHPVNRVPFFLILISSLFLTFTATLVTIFRFLDFKGSFALFQNQGTILGKFICDLILSLILSFIFGFTDIEDHKNSKSAICIIIVFAALPFVLYFVFGSFLEYYVQKLMDMAGPLDQLD